MITKRHALCALVALSISACTEPTSLAPTTTAVDTPPPVQSAEQSILMEVQDRFTLSLEVLTPRPAPGAPLRVRATATGVLPTSDAELVIHFPEVEAARLDGWQMSDLPLRTTLPAATIDRGPLAPGQKRIAEAEIQIPVSGYFRAIATLAKKSTESDIVGGRGVRSAQVVESWFVVDPVNGRVTGTFDRAALPDSVRPIAGPARSKFATPREIQPSIGLSPSRSMMTTGNRRLVYQDPFSRQYFPIDGASATIVVTSCYPTDQSGNSPYCSTAWVYPGSDGMFDAVCPYDPDTGNSGTVTLDSPDVVFNGVIGGVSEWGSSCTDPTVQNVIVNSDAAKLFFNYRDIIIPRSRTFMGSYRGKVAIGLVGGNTSYYDPNHDRIENVSSMIWTTSTYTYPLFVQAHEYGHALHQGALGGISKSGSCPSPHYLNGAYNRGCAWSEGFADFHGAAIIPDLIYEDSDFENNAYYPGGDGSLVEGAFAAFLFDVTDPANEPWDTISLPPGWVANLVASCRVHYGQYHVSETDQMVYCMEGNESAGSLKGWPMAYGVSPNVATPPGWSVAGVRAAWLHDMYGQ